LLISTLRRLNVLSRGGKALHIAPEKAVAQQLFQAFGAGYLAADISVSRLQKHLAAEASRIELDLCNIDGAFAQRRFDLIVHSHVLEHIYGNWAVALLQLQAMLASGGHQVFSIPIFGEYTAEDLDPNLPAGTRLREFHQADHTRRFGATTFAQDMRNIAALTGARYVEARTLFSSDALRAMSAHGHVFVLEAPAG
jgi:phosphoglycolate phosphatase